ncbi:cytochrome b5-related protein [Aedes aegypti]|uniref:Cytochrome b5-related protein n=1 Tax=Aedes aegypti TaxID=7159 RepID=A0A1S4FBG0_AEDAE|nr:cytochrome b5-related protein [Aedes aegypti]XP_021701098.1 cytochrome b5-related protein [Aedes aegypti]
MVNYPWVEPATTTLVAPGDDSYDDACAVDNNNTPMTKFITAKFPSYYRHPLRTVNQWLKGKRRDDDAEGLWRIHDSLYDLTEFIDSHPGGSEWIRFTKGTDITEAFEVHHITARAELVLPKYYVRAARSPRNVRLTFHKHGFYRTLKRRVADKLLTVDYAPVRTSETILDSLLCGSFALACVAINWNSYILAALSGLFVAWTMNCAHNFLHRKDNWRMMAFNLAFFSYREWRVSHALSHHLYPNSLLDLEISFFEPFLCWFPKASKKNLFQRFGSWIYGPLIYTAMCISEIGKRLAETILTKRNTFHADDAICALLPLFMWMFSNSSVWEVAKMWFFIVQVASFVFGIIGLHAAHHHPDIVHSGDLIPADIDFGVYQMASIIDRVDLKGSQFKVLIGFGDHCLHHLFPSLDHGILPQLYPVFFKTCAEFQLEYREQHWLQAVIGQHQQLARIESKVYVPSKK